MLESTINTVGELKELLKKFPDDKPIIIDENGNTRPPQFYDWAGEGDEWPIGIK